MCGVAHEFWRRDLKMPPAHSHNSLLHNLLCETQTFPSARHPAAPDPKVTGVPLCLRLETEPNAVMGRKLANIRSQTMDTEQGEMSSQFCQNKEEGFFSVRLTHMFICPWHQKLDNEKQFVINWGFPKHHLNQHATFDCPTASTLSKYVIAETFSVFQIKQVYDSPLICQLSSPKKGRKRMSLTHLAPK